MSQVSWAEVKRIREASFHGKQPSEAEHRLLRQALKEDRDRYIEIGVKVRSDYAESLKGLL